MFADKIHFTLQHFLLFPAHYIVAVALWCCHRNLLRPFAKVDFASFTHSWIFLFVIDTFRRVDNVMATAALCHVQRKYEKRTVTTFSRLDSRCLNLFSLPRFIYSERLEDAEKERAGKKSTTTTTTKWTGACHMHHNYQMNFDRIWFQVI